MQKKNARRLLYEDALIHLSMNIYLNLETKN